MLYLHEERPQVEAGRAQSEEPESQNLDETSTEENGVVYGWRRFEHDESIFSSDDGPEFSGIEPERSIPRHGSAGSRRQPNHSIRGYRML